MANTDRGKQWEQKFKIDWNKTMTDSFCLRLADQMSGYKTFSQNPCDFICYKFPYLFLMECKAHKGASIPFDVITQYDRLIKYIGIPGLRAGILIWFYEKDVVVYVPVSTIKEMKRDGEKSFGLRHMVSDSKYRYIQIPSEKKIVFMNSDYNILMELQDGD